MVANIDSIANSGAVSPPTQSIPNIRQTPIQPGTDRARSNDRQQKDQAKGGAAFRAELGAVESAAEKFVADVSARRAERKAAIQEKPVRAEKRPQDASVELDANEGERLFVEAQSVAARAMPETPQRRSTDAGYQGHIPSSNEFMVAASRYAERVLTQGGSNIAKPGDSLELTA
jgi:hypothetical protein